MPCNPNSIKLSDVVISSTVDVEVDGGADVSVARSKIDSFAIKQGLRCWLAAGIDQDRNGRGAISSLVDVSTDGDLELLATDSSVGEMSARSTAPVSIVTRIELMRQQGHEHRG